MGKKLTQKEKEAKAKAVADRKYAAELLRRNRKEYRERRKDEMKAEKKLHGYITKFFPEVTIWELDKFIDELLTHTRLDSMLADLANARESVKLFE